MDDLLDRGERFEFRAPARLPWRLQLRRMTPQHSCATIDTDTVSVSAGSWRATVQTDEIASARVTDWPTGGRVGVHYLGHGRWMAAAVPGPLATVDLDPVLAAVTFPRTLRLDVGLAEPDRFVSCIRSRITGDG